MAKKRDRKSPEYLEQQRNSSSKYYYANRERILEEHKNLHNTIDYRIKRMVQAARTRSRDRKFDFNLTFDFIKALWINQEGKCQLSGRVFNLEQTEFRTNPDAPSLDRIDNNKGYTQDNVRLITWQLNMSISEFGFEQFLSLAKDIVNNDKGIV